MENNIIEQFNSSGLCKISIDDGDNWLNGIITYINKEKSIAEIFISAKYFNIFFNHSDNVIVKFNSGSNEILFTGNVDKKILSIHKQALIVKINSIISFWNNRKYERFDVSYMASLDVEEGDKVSSIVKNISFGGVEIFYSNLVAKENDKVFVEIIITPNKTISFHGKVVRCNKVKNGYSYAIQICGIDNKNIETLNKLLEFLSINKKYVTYELKLFKKLKYTVYAVSLLIIIAVALITILTSL